MAIAIHHSARTGFAAKAEAYASGRPDYPPNVAHWLTADLGLAPGKTGFDLGAGTGKFLPYLIATGAAIVAIEPVAEMRAELVARYPAVQALEGTATAIPIGDATADAVVCAQSFHWFATAEALAEIARVLKPGGTLGLIWNNRDLDVAWVAAIEAVTRPYVGTTPSQTSGEWLKLFPALGFTPLATRSFRHSHAGPAEAVIIDRILSVSYIATLPAADQDAVVGKLREIIAATPELAGKDVVTFPYTTAASWCTKL